MSQKEYLKKCTSFEQQQGTRYIWGIIFFSYLSSAKLCLRFFLICFARECYWMGYNLTKTTHCAVSSILKKGLDVSWFFKNM